MYQIVECRDLALWDAAILKLPQPHILQSLVWGETKLQTGWRARRLLWQGTSPVPQSASADLPDQPANSCADLAAASILIRRLYGRLPVAVAYAPKGPLLDWSNLPLVDAVLAGLEAEARRAGALFVKIDPDVCSDTPIGQQIMARLTQRGWHPSAEQIQYRNTMISDLTPDEDALLAVMKPKWRYNIRLAERKGVIVRAGDATDLPAFYRMYVETGTRDGFLVRPFAYYRAVWERFLADGLAYVLLAEVAGAPVAGLILFRYGQTAWYFYGASTAQGRELMPNHALQWAAMRWAKAAGCTRYDWWGAPDTLAESDPMWGVYRFKQGFGGEFVPHIGAWDQPALVLDLHRCDAARAQFHAAAASGRIKEAWFLAETRLLKLAYHTFFSRSSMAALEICPVQASLMNPSRSIIIEVGSERTMNCLLATCPSTSSSSGKLILYDRANAATASTGSSMLMPTTEKP